MIASKSDNHSSGNIHLLVQVQSAECFDVHISSEHSELPCLHSSLVPLRSLECTYMHRLLKWSCFDLNILVHGQESVLMVAICRSSPILIVMILVPPHVQVTLIL